MRMLTALAILLICSLAASAQTVTAVPALYTSTCQKCHGADGKAKTTAGSKMQMPDLGSAQVQKQSDSELFEAIAYGKGHHQYPHAFGARGVPLQAIHDVVAYIRTLKHK